MATTQEFVGLHGQMHEIIKRVGNGFLEASAVKRALQTIIEGKTVALPSWWRSANAQIALARNTWPNVNIPEPPADFAPRTETEVLLLHVPRPFDELWNKVPGNVHKLDNFRTGDNELRLTISTFGRKSPVWLGFDPEYRRGYAPVFTEDLPRDPVRFAASEVLSALIQFPNWPKSWLDGRAASPYLTGYEVDPTGNGYFAVDWNHVPFLFYLENGGGWLGLTSCKDERAHHRYASPSIREC